MSPIDSDSINTDRASAVSSSSPRRALQRPSEGFVSSVFSLLGLGLLLPWNAFISAKPYFEARICSDAVFTGNIEVLISLVFTSSSVLSLFLMIFYQSVKDRFVPEQQASAPLEDQSNRPGDNGDQHPFDDPLIVHGSCEQDSSSNHTFYMVCIPLFIYFLVFLVLAILVFFPSIPASAFFIFLLCSLAICGVMVAVASAGVVAAANRFPPKVAIAHFMTGQAIGGVAVSGAKFVAAVFEDPSVYWNQCGSKPESIEIDKSLHYSITCVPYTQVDWASFTYFLLASVVLGACIIGYNEIDKYQRTMCRSDYEPVQDVADDVRGDSPRFITDFPATQSAVANPKVENDEQEIESSLSSSTFPVWTQVKGPAISIFLAFVVTLAIFPAWTSTLKSSHQCESARPMSRIFNDLYIPATFVTYNLGDLMGRLLVERAPLETIGGLSTKLVVLAVFRATFFVLFLFCTASNSAFPAIQSDIFSLSVQFCFALSNGSLVSAAFMHASKLIPRNDDMQERSSKILNFALSLGLLCGSLLSFCYTSIASGVG